MSRRQMVQSGEGILLELPGYGILQYASKSAPVGGETGFAPGCEWFNPSGTGNTRNTGLMYTNIGSNGFPQNPTTNNPTALWLETDPSNGQQFQFGSGSANMFGSGLLYRNVSTVGLQPAATGAQKVIDIYTLPANSLDGNANFRELCIEVGGNVTGSANCTAQIVFNPTSPVVGQTVSGGTVIATTGTMNTAAQGWNLTANVFCPLGGNVVYQETGTVVATTHGGCGQNTLLAVTTTAAIPIAITIQAASSTANCTLWQWSVQGFN